MPILIYDTWVSDDTARSAAETLTEESQDEELIFGDDTSVRNNSLKKLWIRAKPVFYENSDPDAYTIISGRCRLRQMEHRCRKLVLL